MLNPNTACSNPRFKYLIVNADDYNTDSERNRGIIQAARKGIVTSVSVIANMPWEDDALETLKATMGERIGVHLNLTRGRPLLKGAKTIVVDAGNFYDKQTVWRRALLGRFDLREVEEEFGEQLNHLQKLGINPDHMDGNNHIHIFPGIAEIVTHLAQQYDIKKVRLPLESFTRWKQYFQPHSLKKLLIGTLSRKALKLFKQQGLFFTDNFAGIQFPDVTGIKSLKLFLQILPEGTTELMCHPGYLNRAGSFFSSVQRKQELCSLMHREILEEINLSNIKLISFNEL